MEKASFSIKHYYFDLVKIDLKNYSDGDLMIDFKPKGVFIKDESKFELTFTFYAMSNSNKGKNFIKIRCIGEFIFENAKTIEDIPTYFYRNSIALLFPYLRAYVSLVTNQANIPPLILPTMNLVSLEEPLKNNTKEI
ncbi:protein-export chaperone SecB [Winogradskyella sp. UBA3174]|uniref:protein-export chaperone SecB n=1 Tax=Winogradskyella sp. UBA3174 TaxID=1947785 RepID=UPI0025E9B625|nr:protein-export chaperone SecB [Winogradskyella sp. UBA3174]|tara:strand:- start:8757 stop:9167 length:411 start_codon:yes stop_codon:yes gene_type:complete